MSNNDSWKSPTIIVAIIGLIVSILGNIIQFRQNQFAIIKAEEESNRANKEATRVASLQKTKNIMLQNMYAELSSINRQIVNIKNDSIVAEIGTSVSEQDLQNASYSRLRSSTKQLTELNGRRAALEKQISDLTAPVQ